VHALFAVRVKFHRLKMNFNPTNTTKNIFQKLAGQLGRILRARYMCAMLTRSWFSLITTKNVELLRRRDFVPIFSSPFDVGS
jgi:hypothetical protein